MEVEFVIKRSVLAYCILVLALTLNLVLLSISQLPELVRIMWFIAALACVFLSWKNHSAFSLPRLHTRVRFRNDGVLEVSNAKNRIVLEDYQSKVFSTFYILIYQKSFFLLVFVDSCSVQTYKKVRSVVKLKELRARFEPEVMPE